MRIIVGIDPGQKGGVAITSLSGLDLRWYISSVMPMPMVEPDKDCVDVTRIISEISKFHKDHKPPAVFVELVHAMPGQGVTSMFNFGREYGRVLGMCQASGFELHLVSPQRWKKSMIKKCEAGDQNKACQRIWPGSCWLKTPRCRVPHDGMQDAALIAMYGAGVLKSES